MSYVVSARRWRPQTFEDLIGQEHVARTLTNALRSGRVAHALLFTGLRGVGKTTAARIVAKALNCERGPAATPCNSCTNCEEITAGRSVDVLEIDGASNTGVDDVRQIIENVRYQAARCRYKIYIIDEVHMLSNSAFNALLKTLEEPPPHVKFIFATTDPHKLPATVQSRCQRYDFRRIPLRAVTERLRMIVAAEGASVSDQALWLVAREGVGSMRDAQSLLDQVLAYGGEKIDVAEVVAVLGVADRAVIAEIVDALADRDGAKALAAVDRIYQHGHDLRRLSRDLIEHVRNVAVAKVSRSELLPDIADEERALVRKQAERISSEDCDRAFRILQEADEEASRSPYPKLVLEMALIRIATMPSMVPVEQLLQRVEEVETRLRRGGAGTTGGGAARSNPSPTRQPGPPAGGRPRAMERGPAAAAEGSTGGGTWTAFVEFVARERATLAHHLRKCAPGEIGSGGVRLRAPRGFYYDYLARADHVAQISALATRFFERPLTVAVECEPSGNGAEKPAPEAAPESSAQLAETALGNPAVRAAVEILGGEVQEVRRRPRSREER
jgi:DNA polymerase-3 subunit gamma/tau